MIDENGNKYDYDARVAEVDMNVREGVGRYLAGCLRDWRDDEIDDLEFDGLVQAAVSALLYGFDR